MPDRSAPPRSPALSAGLLLHRGAGPALEVLLVHPGGPFWARRDAGAWSIPKGEIDPGEDPLAAARREFAEELGSPAPGGAAIALGEIRQKSGKRVTAWGLAGDLDPETVVSNTFTMPWPPGSGRETEFPEVDRAAWCSPAQAREKLVPAQVQLLERLLVALGEGAP